jgi:hypothetical protein
MTLPLRRKHRTTRPNTTRSKVPDTARSRRSLAIRPRASLAIAGLAVAALLASGTSALAEVIPSSRSGLRRAPNQSVPLTPVTDSGWTGRGQRIAASANTSPPRTTSGRYQWGDLGLAENDSAVEPAQATMSVPEMIQPEAACDPRQRWSSGGGRGYGSYQNGVRMVQRPGQLPPSTIPPFEEAFQQAPQSLEVNCDLERQKLKPINAVTNKIAAEPGTLPPECSLGNVPYQPRNFACLTYTWKASNLCHKPLYFEQVRVERYGHALPPPIQPFAGAAHFFCSFVLLPYKIGMELPNECVYSLGYYRPSSCAPMQIPGIPLSVRGAALETGMISGTAFLLPFAPP